MITMFINIKSDSKTLSFIDIRSKPFMFSILPMIFVKTLIGGFSIQIGTFSFFIEFVRMKRYDKDDIDAIIEIAKKYGNN